MVAPPREADETGDLEGPTMPAGAGCAGSRTSTSSTRWTAAPRAWRWSAATSAARSRRSHPRASSTPRRRHEPGAGSSRAPRRSGSTPAPFSASKSRLDELPLPAVVPLGGQPLGRRLPRATTARADRRPGPRPPPPPPRGVPRGWSGYAALFSATRRAADAPEGQPSLAGSGGSSRPNAAAGAALLLALAAAGAAAAPPHPDAGHRRRRPARRRPRALLDVLVLAHARRAARDRPRRRCRPALPPRRPRCGSTGRRSTSSPAACSTCR